MLFAPAKPANSIVASLIGLFALRFGKKAWPSAVAICGAAVFMIATTPRELRNANTYNVLFLAWIPESWNPAADLQALGLDWQYQDLSRTGAWCPGNRYPELAARGDIGVRVTQLTLLKFYASRPSRFWRHIQAKLPIAMSMRPPYGNFEPGAGDPFMSDHFAWWSGFHQRALQPAAKFLFFALIIPLAALVKRRDLAMQFVALLAICALTAFLTAIFGDAWDDIKHLFLFICCSMRS